MADAALTTGTIVSLRPGSTAVPVYAPAAGDILDDACRCGEFVSVIAAPAFPDITAPSGRCQFARCLVCNRLNQADAADWQPDPPLTAVQNALAALEQRRLRIALLLQRTAATVKSSR